MLASSPYIGLAHKNMLHRWIRILAQVFAITIAIVVAAVVSRTIYLQFVPPQPAELEDVSDIERPSPGCPTPDWERNAPQTQSTEREITRHAGCLES